jgi:hypothetical protein
MSLDLSKFQAASKAAEGWLNTVGHVARLGRCGSVTPAFELLMPTPSTKDGRPYNLQDSYFEHEEVLEQAQDALTALSDSPVKWEHGRGLSGIAPIPAAVYPHVWSSAHEAAAGIARLALQMLVWPLAGITDPAEQRTLAEQLLAKCCEALTIPLDEQAVLFERIRRERAKLLAQYSPRAENAEKTTSQTLPKPDTEGEQPPPLTPEDAAILKVLLQANGVTMIVNKIEAKVRFTDKTIRTRLKKLRALELVHEPEKNKGYTTTAKGMDAAKNLPADAGAQLIRSERAGH